MDAWEGPHGPSQSPYKRKKEIERETGFGNCDDCLGSEYEAGVQVLTARRAVRTSQQAFPPKVALLGASCSAVVVHFVAVMQCVNQC